mmetsp:Transcript_4102/g.14689  ORF Transcript_4102/g.14689 Transcript_4102/m.14689 type:complete len:80 (-) Transcript_4102:777-1016(-)|eukprot:scaffold451_cov365-Prasinococcus_capsulatus_cf.AAC.8
MAAFQRHMRKQLQRDDGEDGEWCSGLTPYLATNSGRKGLLDVEEDTRPVAVAVAAGKDGDCGAPYTKAVRGPTGSQACR